MPLSVATPNMNLATWPTTAHLFNHTELNANFSAIDSHDHTTDNGVPIPAGGLAAGAVTTSTFAPGAVDTLALGSAQVTDGKLASPNNGVYRTLLTGHGIIAGGTAAGGYILSPSGLVVATGGTITFGAYGISLVSADYAVAGLTTKLRIRGALTLNTVSTTSTFAVGLYPVTVGGTSGNLTLSLGSVVTGSATSAVTPTTSSATGIAGADFTFPSDGFYILGVVIVNANAAGAQVGYNVRLQLHNV